MLITIPLAECLDLIDLVVTGDCRGSSFDLGGAHCGVERFDDPHGWFGAAGPDWEFMMMLPGWYAGELGPPIRLSIEGDTLTCLQWLPIDREDKHAIIKRIRLGRMKRTLLMLAV